MLVDSSWYVKRNTAIECAIFASNHVYGIRFGLHRATINES